MKCMRTRTLRSCKVQERIFRYVLGYCKAMVHVQTDLSSSGKEHALGVLLYGIDVQGIRCEVYSSFPHSELLRPSSIR